MSTPKREGSTPHGSMSLLEVDECPLVDEKVSLHMNPCRDGSLDGCPVVCEEDSLHMNLGRGQGLGARPDHAYAVVGGAGNAQPLMPNSAAAGVSRVGTGGTGRLGGGAGGWSLSAVLAWETVGPGIFGTLFSPVTFLAAIPARFAIEGRLRSVRFHT